MYVLKKKLLYYASKYSNCNSTRNPLYCGHKYEGYKLQKKDIYPNNVIVKFSNYKQIKIIGNTICRNNKIIVGVVSAPDNFLQRLALRMGYISYGLALIFFTGLSTNYKVNKLVKNENEYYHDIIIFDFVSHYFNSSLMLVLELNWIYNNCKKYKYFIYHTPDVYFNYFLFYKIYITNVYTYPLIADILVNNKVLRSNRSRFYVPLSIYSNKYYPLQPNGPLIAFSLDTIKKIVNNIEKVNMTFWMDDVYLAFLIQHIKIKTYQFKNVISTYPIQSKTLPTTSFIISNITYIHSLPPGSIYFLLQVGNKYYNIST